MKMTRSERRIRRAERARDQQLPFWQRPIFRIRNKRILGIGQALRNLCAKIFMPRTSEFRLFVLAYSFLFLVLIDRALRHGVVGLLRDTINSGHPLDILIWPLLIAAGIAVSIYHALSRRKKGNLERYLMLLFGCLANGAIAAFTIDAAIDLEPPWLVAIPFWNLILALAHFFIINAGADWLQEVEMPEADWRDIVFAAAAASALLGAASVLRLHWLIRVSIVQAISPVFSRGTRRSGGQPKRNRNAAAAGRASPAS